MIGVDEKERRSGGWHPRILAFFVAAALGLSVGASLDCKFLTVELPFVPEGYRGRELSFGLWSYEAPRGGECLSLGASHRSGGFARDDDIYSNAFINHDTNWSTARCLAISCALFGSTALIFVGVNIFKVEPHFADILVYLLITAFLIESAKFGLFMGVDVCTSLYWYNIQSHEYSSSIDCGIDRGAILSICSIAAYLASAILALSFAATPTPKGYDEASLRSWMASEVDVSAEHRSVTFAQDEMDRRGGMNGPAWSQSAPSTMVSRDASAVGGDRRAPLEDYAVEEYAATPEEEGEFGTIVIPVVPEERHPKHHIPAYPPTNRPRPKYDDTSTLTFDPGY